MRLNKLNIFSIIFFLFLIFCGNARSTTFELDKESEKVEILESLNIDYFKQLNNDQYIVGVGDTLEIVVANDYPELQSYVIVDGEGTINLPLLKKIYIKGLTIDELEVLLDKAYLEYVRFSNVKVNVIKYRPINVLVEGEISEPGLHKLVGSLSTDINTLENLSPKNNFSSSKIFDESSTRIKPPEVINFYFPTLFDAIRAGGGITRYSDLSNITIIRKENISNGGGRKLAYVNFKDLLLTGDQSGNIRIYDGDIIKIPKLSKPDTEVLHTAIRSKLNPRIINVFITGRVNLPGLKSIPTTTTLNDAIEISGGAKFLKGKIKYLSFSNNGVFESREFRFKKRRRRGSEYNPYLKNGDLIIVGESFLSNTSQLISEITSPFQGIYTTIKLIEAF